METFYLSFDCEEFDAKPKDEKLPEYADKRGNPRKPVEAISTRIADGAKRVTQKQLEKNITRGITWMGSVYNRCPDWGRRRRLETLWESMSAICLDFDNNSDLHELSDILYDIDMDFSIVHRTFSHTDEHHKYRGIILLDEPITERKNAYIANYYFRQLFQSHIDRACIDLARLFFGGRADCITYTSSYRANIDRILALSGESIRTEVETTYFQRRTIAYDNSASSIISSVLSDAPYSFENQKRRIQELPESDRCRIVSKVKTEIKWLKAYDGSKKFKESSRYQRLFNTARILGMYKTLYPEAIEMWLLDAVNDNPHYDDWDKNVLETIRRGVEYGRKCIQ